MVGQEDEFESPVLVVSKAIIPSFSTVEDEAESAYFLQQLQAHWGDEGAPVGGRPPPARSRRPNKRPASRGPVDVSAFGCHPMSVSGSALSSLDVEKYLVALKSDGVRYTLFLTVRPNSAPGTIHPVALMIDRGGKMYEVETKATRPFFEEGTILEGELVFTQPSEKSMTFLVFDCLRVAGKSFLHAPFSERISRVAEVLSIGDRVCEMDDVPEVERAVRESGCVVCSQLFPPITFRAKTFVCGTHVPTLWANRASCEHNVDGVILNLSDAPYRSGTAWDSRILKWKQHPSVDLVGRAARAADGDVPASLFGREVVVSTSSSIVPLTDDEILEYVVRVGARVISLFAIRRRPDKPRANTKKVVARTVQDAIENATIEHLWQRAASPTHLRRTACTASR